MHVRPNNANELPVHALFDGQSLVGRAVSHPVQHVCRYQLARSQVGPQVLDVSEQPRSLNERVPGPRRSRYIGSEVDPSISATPLGK